MRKLDHNSVKADFDAALGAIRAFHVAAAPGLQQLRDLSRLAELVLLNAASLWEGFISDLFVAYINLDGATATAAVVSEVQIAIKRDFGPLVSGYVHINMPRHIKRDDVNSLIDPRGRNISFRDGKELRRGAKKKLIAAHAAPFLALCRPDVAAITAWIKLRNCIAHRSRSAYSEMNAALAKHNLKQPPNEYLARGAQKVWNVGAFLRAVPVVGEECRILRYLDRMRFIAAYL